MENAGDLALRQPAAPSKSPPSAIISPYIPEDARTAFQDISYLEKEHAELALIDQLVFEPGSPHLIQDLFNSGSAIYESDFDLKNLLGNPNVHHSVWDIGSGPKGRHLIELSSNPQYSNTSFFGISPWMHPKAPDMPYNGRPPLMMAGIVQALDTSVFKRATEDGVEPPDIILSRNTLRHLLKSGYQEFELARGFEAMNNALPIGGKIIIVENVTQEKNGAELLYNAYTKLIGDMGLPLMPTIKKSEASPNHTLYLELVKIAPEILTPIEDQ